MEKKFKSNDEFLAHLFKTIEVGKFCYIYDDSVENCSVIEEDEFNIYYLGEDFNISGIAITLLSIYGLNLVMKIEHEIETPFELGNTGKKVYEKFLTVTFWSNDEVGCQFHGNDFTVKNANKDEA